MKMPAILTQKEGKKPIVRTEEWRRKQSLSHKGQSHPHSEEAKLKLRNMRLGEKNPFYGKTHTPEFRMKLHIIHSGSGNHNYGKPLPEETRKKLRSYKGENTSNWKGGVSKLVDRIRGCTRYSEWRTKVYERDLYTDWFSGVSGSRNRLNAHHIISLNKLLKIYNITTVEEAENCDALWDINNGITLLKSSHDSYHDMWGK